MPKIIDGMTCYTMKEAKESFDQRVEENIKRWERNLQKV